MPGIGVIVNPHARGNRNGADARARRLADIVRGDGLVRTTESLPAIQEVAREFRDRDIDILAVCGGDGSYHCTLTGFRAVYGDAPLPRLLPLRAGTINYVAKATGGRRGSAESTLSRVLYDYRWGGNFVTVERDLLRVNGVEHGFVLSFGTAVNFLKAYYALDRQGPTRAAVLLTKMILSALAGTHSAQAVFKSTGADVECDGFPVPFRQFTFFFASTVDRIALGFKPTYLATRKPGFFHVLGGPIPAHRLIRRAVRVYRGFPTGEPMLYDSIAARTTIHFFRPEAWMLDGDILPPAERLEVEVACRVTLIRP